MKLILKIAFSVAVVLGAGSCKKGLAPDPETAFLKFYGGEGNQMAGGLEQTADGGYIILGTSTGFSGGTQSDLFLVKTDAKGNQQWYKTYGGEASDSGFSVKKTSDGGYVLLGNYMNSSETDMYLVKVDAQGTEQWSAKYDNSETFNGSQTGFDVLPLSTGGYFLSGGTTFNGGTIPWFVKTDNAGTKLIQRMPPFSEFSGVNNATSAIEIDETTIICSAVQPIKTERSLSIIKFNATLGYGYGYNKKDVNVSENNAEEAAQIKQTADGGLIVVGTTTPNTDAGKQIYLLKMMPNGTGNGYEKAWYREYGTAAGDEGASVDVCTDGGFIVCGTTFGKGDLLGDIYVFKTDKDGNRQWENSFGGEGPDKGVKIICDKKGGYAALGTVTWSVTSGRRMISLIKLTESGSLTE